MRRIDIDSISPREREALVAIAEAVRTAGGRALMVGGSVRDLMLGSPVKDVDIEVFGVEPDRLRAIVGGRFPYDECGASFGVLKLKHVDIDVSLPRRESKSGSGHRAFSVSADPSLTVREASSRRDFTVNAMYYDPLADAFEDPWNGAADLERRVLRHVSGKFGEDPLRVLRGMQFAARFGLDAAPETVAVCRGMTPEGLACERLFEEWSKFLLKGRDMTRGMRFLRDTGWVRYYPELERLIGCEQAPEWHPEGDVWNHTCCCLDAFAAKRGLVDDDGENIVVGLAVLCHDFGKPAVSVYDRVKKRITAKGHDEAGVEPTLSFLRRLTNEERLLREVPPLVRLHMRPFSMWRGKSGDSAVRRLAAQVVRIDRLIRVATADDEGRPPFPPQPEHLQWLAEAAERLRVADSAPKPLLMGRDLIAMGFKPSPLFGKWLSECYEAQLDGKFGDREGAIAYFRGLASGADLQCRPLF